MRLYKIKNKSFNKKKNEALISYQEISVWRPIALFFFFGSLLLGFVLFSMAHQDMTSASFMYKVLGTLATIGLLLAFYFHPSDWNHISLKNGTIHTATHNTVKASEVKQILVRPNQKNSFVSAYLHNYEIPLTGVISVKAAYKIEKIVQHWLSESQKLPSVSALKTPSQFKKI